MDARTKFQEWFAHIRDTSSRANTSRTGRYGERSSSTLPPPPALPDTMRRKVTAKRLQWAQQVVQSSNTSVATVARHLDVTPQTLRRYLRADGTLRREGRELLDGAATSSPSAPRYDSKASRNSPSGPLHDTPGLNPPPPGPEHGNRKVTADRLRWAQGAIRDHDLSLRQVATVLDIHSGTLGSYVKGDASLREKGRELIDDAAQSTSSRAENDSASKPLPDTVPAPPPTPDQGRRKVTAERLLWSQKVMREANLSLHDVADALDVHYMTLFSYLTSDGSIRAKGKRLVADR